ncbi:hypothetical protein ACFQLX_13355 [Streptomyces polyrhachis]|uniref:Uncharacterized protein n=1 Tax=Streptomyces polyrhachis TaxID=1282885 RepID=A0ABW2GEG2_9ACTN
MPRNAASTMRYGAGGLVVLLGAAIALYSPFRSWYNGRHGRYYSVDDLFGGISDTRAVLMESLFVPMLVVAVLALLGVLMRSRILTALSGLLVLATVVTWMVRVGQVSDGIRITTSGSGLGMGVLGALFGALAILAGTVLMGSRRAAGAQSTGKHARGAPAPVPVGEQHWEERQHAGDAHHGAPDEHPEEGPYVQDPVHPPPEHDTAQQPTADSGKLLHFRKRHTADQPQADADTSTDTGTDTGGQEDSGDHRNAA